MFIPHRTGTLIQKDNSMQTSGSNPRCTCRETKNPQTCEMTMKAYERNDRLFASQNRSVTANSGTLVLNASIRHRYGGESIPLIPPRPVEIVANERRAEMDAAQKPTVNATPPQSVSLRGPLIPPKLW